jgi:hypothetical protein
MQDVEQNPCQQAGEVMADDACTRTITQDSKEVRHGKD